MTEPDGLPSDVIRCDNKSSLFVQQLVTLLLVFPAPASLIEVVHVFLVCGKHNAGVCAGGGRWGLGAGRAG